MVIGVDIDDTIKITDLTLGPCVPDSFEGWPDLSAQKVLSDLSARHRIIYITSRHSRTRIETVRWLQKHKFPHPSSVFFSDGGSKGDLLSHLGVDLFIDDDVDHALEALGLGIEVILVDRWYNQKFTHPKLIRESNWSNISRIIGSKTEEPGA